MRDYGIKWMVRRVVRELIRPTTRFRSYIMPFSALFYHGVSRPLSFLSTLVVKNNHANDTLYFFYDFEVEPVTYDFVWALSVANAKREELGLSHLHVVLVPGSYGGLRKELVDYESQVPHEARLWRLHAMILTSVKLLPLSCGVTLCSSRAQASLIRAREAKHIYPSSYNVAFPIPHAPELAAIYGPMVCALRADKQAKRYVMDWLHHHAKQRKTIVVTLRNYTYTPERNSNVQAWIRFANGLDKQKYFVVFIADTEQALHPVSDELRELTFFNEACWNLNLRMAIYELAYLNLGVNTGPMALCWFNAACRYITFKAAVKNVPAVPLRMITDKGFTPHQNAPFAGNFQKWVWEDDDFDIIIEEFEHMCKRIG